jgi:hypothetical protein
MLVRRVIEEQGIDQTDMELIAVASIGRNSELDRPAIGERPVLQG